MNHMIRNASFATARCRKSIQSLTSRSEVLGFIRQITSYAQSVDKGVRKLLTRLRHSQVIHMLDMVGTLQARALKGAHPAPLKRRAQGVAVVIGIALSIGYAPSTQGSIEAIQSIKQIADYQLTESQEYCHNQIIYRESRFNIDAVNGSHYGYYQGRSDSLIDASAEYQFYWYWSYVAHRYGVTQYDEPDYCKALHHLRVKGWQ